MDLKVLNVVADGAVEGREEGDAAYTRLMALCMCCGILEIPPRIRLPTSTSATRPPDVERFFRIQELVDITPSVAWTNADDRLSGDIVSWLSNERSMVTPDWILVSLGPGACLWKRRLRSA